MGPGVYLIIVYNKRVFMPGLIISILSKVWQHHNQATAQQLDLCKNDMLNIKIFQEADFNVECLS